jgi:hypothetical protein
MTTLYEVNHDAFTYPRARRSWEMDSAFMQMAPEQKKRRFEEPPISSNPPTPQLQTKQRQKRSYEPAPILPRISVINSKNLDPAEDEHPALKRLRFDPKKEWNELILHPVFAHKEWEDPESRETKVAERRPETISIEDLISLSTLTKTDLSSLVLSKDLAHMIWEAAKLRHAGKKLEDYDPANIEEIDDAEEQNMMDCD